MCYTARACIHEKIFVSIIANALASSVSSQLYTIEKLKRNYGTNMIRKTEMQRFKPSECIGLQLTVLDGDIAEDCKMYQLARGQLPPASVSDTKNA